MPIKLNWSVEGVEYICSGRITLDDVLTADDKVFSDPKFMRAQYILINALDVDFVELSELEIQIDVTNDLTHSLKNENLKLAFIAAKPHIITVAELYVKAFRRKHISWQVELFATEQRALHWVTQTK